MGVIKEIRDALEAGARRLFEEYHSRLCMMRRFEVIVALVLSVGCGFSACAVGHVFRGRWITDAEMAAQVPRHRPLSAAQ